MSAGREAFDLFHPACRRNFKDALKWKWKRLYWWKLVLSALRAEFAKTFAAAWLPLIYSAVDAEDDFIGELANERGLLMADELIRRLRESK